MDPYLVPLLFCFELPIHPPVLCCVIKTPVLGRSPCQRGMGKEAGLPGQAWPLALWKGGE